MGSVLEEYMASNQGKRIKNQMPEPDLGLNQK
jgi:hypothetical protein